MVGGQQIFIVNAPGCACFRMCLLRYIRAPGSEAGCSADPQRRTGRSRYVVLLSAGLALPKSNAMKSYSVHLDRFPVVRGSDRRCLSVFRCDADALMRDVCLLAVRFGLAPPPSHRIPEAPSNTSGTPTHRSWSNHPNHIRRPPPSAALDQRRLCASGAEGLENQ